MSGLLSSPGEKQGGERKAIGIGIKTKMNKTEWQWLISVAGPEPSTPLPPSCAVGRLSGRLHSIGHGRWERSCKNGVIMSFSQMGDLLSHWNWLSHFLPLLLFPAAFTESSDPLYVLLQDIWQQPLTPSKLPWGFYKTDANRGESCRATKSLRGLHTVEKKR